MVPAGEDQQRRMLSHSARLMGRPSVAPVAIQKRANKEGSGKLRKDFSADCTIATRSRAAARVACSALTGPWTAEYGPCIAGKRKIVRTQTTANTASSAPVRPDVIAVPPMIISKCGPGFKRSKPSSTGTSGRGWWSYRRSSRDRVSPPRSHLRARPRA